jgi:pyruvate/2-oxoglutarate dehydrogenase complex dihydrolipoamide dehydrogenase (E3) component
MGALRDTVAGERRIRGHNFIIATGSSPVVLGIGGLGEAGYLTSDTVWNLDELPGRLAVIGGGSTGVELGQAFSRLGSRVTLLEAMPRIVPRAEPEMSAALAGALAGEGMDVVTGARVMAALRTSGGIELDVDADGVGPERKGDDEQRDEGRHDYPVPVLDGRISHVRY